MTIVICVAALYVARSASTSLHGGPPGIIEQPRAVLHQRTTNHADDLPELQARIKAIARGRLSAGMSIAVVEDGRTVWATGFGYADVAAGRRTTADTVYRVGSFSKSVVALTMASLETDGRLDLSAPLVEVVDDVEFEDPFAPSHPIRVAHLLEHSSGFDEMRFNEMFAEPDELDWSMARVLALNPRSRRARWHPGTRHSYSHPGYTMAGHILEKAAGAPYDVAVRERIFDPLGLQVASFRPTAATEAQLAVPYDEHLEPLPPLYLHHRPGSHLYISAREFGRILELLTGRGVVNGTRVVPESAIARIEHGGTLPYSGLSPSYGLGVYSGQKGGVISMMHGGWMPGYHSVYRYVPSVGAGYVLLTNEPKDHDAIWEIDAELGAYMRRRAVPEQPPPEVDLDPSRLAELAGAYTQRYSEVEFTRAFELGPPVEVEVSGQGLVLRHPDDEPMRLVPVDGSRFRGKSQSRPSVLFTRSTEGAEVLWDANWFGYYERVSTAWATTRQGLIAFAQVALKIGLVWPALWIPLMFVRRRRVPAVCAWPCLGAWSSYLFIVTLYDTPIPELGGVNAHTVAAFLLSCALPLCTIASVVSSIRARRTALHLRVVAIAVTAGLTLATVHFAVHGLLGVRTWMW